MNKEAKVEEMLMKKKSRNTGKTKTTEKKQKGLEEETVRMRPGGTFVPWESL